MNLNSLSGGIMLAALAGVWLLVFVPSWASSSKDRDARRQQYEAARQNQKLELSKVQTSPILQSAMQARRAKSLKRITGFASLAFLSAFGWSLTLIASSPSWWVWSSISVVGLGLVVGINRLADKKYQEALTKATRGATRMKYGVRPSGVSNSINTDAAQEPAADPRAWAATGVPSQLYRSATGTLATPKLAEVVAFADEVVKREDKTAVSNDTASINIDEIMRRRRANG
jgi:hypothetical protein